MMGTQTNRFPAVRNIAGFCYYCGVELEGGACPECGTEWKTAYTWVCPQCYYVRAPDGSPSDGLVYLAEPTYIARYQAEGQQIIWLASGPAWCEKCDLWWIYQWQRREPGALLLLSGFDREGRLVSHTSSAI